MENKGPSLLECFEKAPFLLMEGALGERLKREYGLQFDEQVAMAALVRSSPGRPVFPFWPQRPPGAPTGSGWRGPVFRRI